MEQENSLIPEEEIKAPETEEISASQDARHPADTTDAEHQPEQKENPDIDFSHLNTDEIIRKAHRLLNDFPLSAI